MKKALYSSAALETEATDYMERHHHEPSLRDGRWWGAGGSHGGA